MKEKYVFIVDKKFVSEMPYIIEFFSDNLLGIVDFEHCIEDECCGVNVIDISEIEVESLNKIVIFSEMMYVKIKDYLISNFAVDDEFVIYGQKFLNEFLNLDEVTLFNIGRHSKDFEFLFPQIKIRNRINNLKNFDRNSLLIICDIKSDKLISELNDNNLKYKQDYIWFEDMGIFINDLKYLRDSYSNFDYIHNYVFLKNMIYSKSYDNIRCTYPFDFLTIYPGGDVHICCGGWSNSNFVGNLLEESLDDIWNSYAFNLRRVSIINKTYCFCKKDTCPHLNYEWNLTDTRFDDLEKLPYPKTASICIDRSCNLYCESCREKHYKASGEALERANILKNKILETSWFENVCMHIAGDGEAFYSDVYQDIIFGGKNKSESIILLCNGTLFVPKNLDRLRELYKYINISISIDAATKETYTKLRRGGNFDFLMKNLEYISKCKKEDSKICFVELNFVIQRKNYLEIPAFLEIAKKFDFTCCNFSRIRNWGTYTKDEFDNIDMFDETGAPKEELKKVLDSIDDDLKKYINSSSYIAKF